MSNENKYPYERYKEKDVLRKKRNKVENWLKKNQRFINFTGIEKEISAPKGLVQKFIKYDKRVNDKWIEPLHGVVKEITSLKLK